MIRCTTGPRDDLAASVCEGGHMTTERAVLLIADIGGYTQYLGSHRLSLAHVEVNTGRLLERIIEAAQGFDLIEIEGDAAFLSRRAGSPATEVDAVQGILQVAVAMHRAFHLEREYVAANLCPCGGCKETRALTLKFVAHVGEVASQSIRGRIKLVGIDVILVHRLLKNPVPVPEYVLLSEDLYRTAGSALPDGVREISVDLEGIGSTGAYYLDVADLDELPPLSKPTIRTRLASTLSAVGRGLPYMVGIKRRQHTK
jgi:class 3 adenylate cyclase